MKARWQVINRIRLKLAILIAMLIMLQFNLMVPSYARVASLTFKTNDEANNIEVFSKASPAVVFVTNKGLRRDIFSFNVFEIQQGTGSGIIWDKEGIIVTSYHVIQSADVVTVRLRDHSEWEANVVGLAPEKDLAVLKINAPEKLLTSLPIADSNQLEVGRKVLAIGNPFGLDTTLTVGVVSALGREIQSTNDRTIKDVIQTDAAINPGNSGGPLLNSSGELIGVNMAIYSPSGANAGIGFAIPVNTVKKIVPQLIKYGRLIRPVLGVEIMPDYWARRYGIEGVAILAVSPNYPAAKAGLQGLQQNIRGEIKLGDIIVAIEGENVRNSDDLLSELENHKPGEIVLLQVRKANGPVRSVKVKLVAP